MSSCGHQDQLDEGASTATRLTSSATAALLASGAIAGNLCDKLTPMVTIAGSPSPRDSGGGGRFPNRRHVGPGRSLLADSLRRDGRIGVKSFWCVLLQSFSALERATAEELVKDETEERANGDLRGR